MAKRATEKSFGFAKSSTEKSPSIMEVSARKCYKEMTFEMKSHPDCHKHKELN